MGFITKEDSANKKVRKVLGIPVFAMHKKQLRNALRTRYKLFGIPIYQRKKKTCDNEDLLLNIQDKLNRVGYLVDSLWLSNLQNEKFCGQLGQDALAYSILYKKNMGFLLILGHMME